MHNIFNEIVCDGLYIFELITGAANFIFAFRPLADSKSKINEGKKKKKKEMMKNKKMRDRKKESKEKKEPHTHNTADDENDYRPQNTSFDALAI